FPEIPGPIFFLKCGEFGLHFAFLLLKSLHFGVDFCGILMGFLVLLVFLIPILHCGLDGRQPFRGLGSELWLRSQGVAIFNVFLIPKKLRGSAPAASRTQIETTVLNRSLPPAVDPALDYGEGVLEMPGSGTRSKQPLYVLLSLITVLIRWSFAPITISTFLPAPVIIPAHILRGSS